MKLLICTVINDENVDKLPDWANTVSLLPYQCKMFVADSRTEKSFNDEVHKLLKKLQRSYGVITERIKSVVPQVQLIYNSEARDVDVMVYWDLSVPVTLESLSQLVSLSLVKPTAPYVSSFSKHIVQTKQRLIAIDFEGLKTINEEELILPEFVFGVNKAVLSRIPDSWGMNRDYDPSFAVYLFFQQLGVKFTDGGMII
jgi:hypothetical protein